MMFNENFKGFVFIVWVVNYKRQSNEMKGICSQKIHAPKRVGMDSEKGQWTSKEGTFYSSIIRRIATT